MPAYTGAQRARAGGEAGGRINGWMVPTMGVTQEKKAGLYPRRPSTRRETSQMGAESALITLKCERFAAHVAAAS